MIIISFIPIMLSLVLCGVWICLNCQESYAKYISRCISAHLSPDEHIVCHNATVTYDEQTGTVRWYDNEQDGR